MSNLNGFIRSNKSKCFLSLVLVKSLSLSIPLYLIMFGIMGQFVDTLRLFYKRLELLTLREHLGSPPVFLWVRVARLFSFLCCVFLFWLSPSCVVCTRCCQFLWIFHSWFPLRFSLFALYNTYHYWSSHYKFQEFTTSFNDTLPYGPCCYAHGTTMYIISYLDLWI
jgi:hypothetical protein